jgi:hypothetical protein
VVRPLVLVLLALAAVSCTSGARPLRTPAPQAQERGSPDSLSSAALDALLIAAVARELCRQLTDRNVLPGDLSGDTLMVLKLGPRVPIFSDPCKLRSRRSWVRAA